MRRFWRTPRAIALRILFDHNVPVGVRSFLNKHEVRTIIEMGWPPQMENGELLKAAEAANFDVLVTSDQNIRYQQDARNRKLALIVLGSNIWPIVRNYAVEIAAEVEAARPGSCAFIEMQLPPTPPRP